MKLMILGNDLETREFQKYDITPPFQDFEEDQKNYNAIFSTRPEYLVDKKIRIPYFYNIPNNYIKDEQNFNVFNQYYSKIKGADAVFVSAKRLNKYCEWMGFNTYWINSGIELGPFQYKKFLTPKLHIGYSKEHSEIMDKVKICQKNNWEFHTSDNLENVFRESHVFLDLNENIQGFPSPSGMEALSRGCVLISSNSYGNNTHILFDKVHYFKLDFVNSNLIVDFLRHADKRREKLERMAIAGRQAIKKYFNLSKIVDDKIRIIKKIIY